MPDLDWTPLLRTPGFAIAASLLGLVVGSFANVCIHRLAVDYEPAPGRLGFLVDIGRQLRSLGYPGSHCPRCNHAIRPWDNVPVVSWLVLRGRCRDCGEPIALRYPAVELLNGLLWLGLALRHGAHAQTAVEMLLVSALLVLALVDLEHQLLPDAVTIPGAMAGIALAVVVPGWPVRPLAAFASALGGYLLFALLAWTWRRLRGVEALGQGDWKLAAMLGAFLGWQRLLLVLLLASSVGSLAGVAMIASGRGHWQSRLPFGTFIAAAAILAVFFGSAWISWYGGVLAR